MKLMSISAGLATIVIGASALAPAPATADGLVLPELTTVFTALQVDQALTAVTDTITAVERAAVDEYLNSVVDEAGNVLSEADVEVGTLVSGSLKIAVVAPDFGVSVGSMTVSATVEDAVPEFSVGAETTMDDTADDATSAGPGMGTWPDWTSSWHASIRIKIYFGNDYLGDGLFQTFKRKLQNDGSGAVDYWQVSRRAVGRPAQWEGRGPNGPMTVKKLWASQKLTSASQAQDREWMLNLTSPQEGFGGCRDGVEFTAGPFTFIPKECDEYDVWTGDIGHQRMYMDQGGYAHGGSRSLAYKTGFSIANNYAPAFTWYEFVTLRIGSGGPDMKCADEWVGTVNGTGTGSCTYTSTG